MNGENVNKAYWYYYGTMDRTFIEYYLPNLVIMLIIFNIVPLALLALYPFKRFSIQIAV